VAAARLTAAASSAPSMGDGISAGSGARPMLQKSASGTVS